MYFTLTSQMITTPSLPEGAIRPFSQRIHLPLETTNDRNPSLPVIVRPSDHRPQGQRGDACALCPSTGRRLHGRASARGGRGVHPRPRACTHQGTECGRHEQGIQMEALGLKIHCPLLRRLNFNCTKSSEI